MVNTSSIFKANEYFSNLCENISSNLNKDGFDVKTKVYGDNTASLFIYSDEYGNSKITLHYSSSITNDDVIFVSDDNTNECNEFYVNSEKFN